MQAGFLDKAKVKKQKKLKPPLTLLLFQTKYQDNNNVTCLLGGAFVVAVRNKEPSEHLAIGAPAHKHGPTKKRPQQPIRPLPPERDDDERQSARPHQLARVADADRPLPAHHVRPSDRSPQAAVASFVVHVSRNAEVMDTDADYLCANMVYAYWKVGRHNDHAVFDLFFRKNPFKGEYTVFAGLEEALALINTFKFTESDIAYLRVVLPNAEDTFFQWLATLDCSQIKVYAIKEGTIVFPRIPLLRIEGNLAVGQLLETPLLNLLNFASLITTNATRFKRAAGPDKSLLEFGLRRAQGPDGGLSASRYSYMAGFAGTSNVLAGKLHNIPIKGTHAHAFVQAHTDLGDVKVTMLDGKNFLEIVLKYRRELECTRTNDGELAAFISYAIAFPSAFLALVDTYETLTSGVPNFLCVALALHELGYKPVGIRLDSGDLSYLSKQARVAFKATAERFGIDYFSKLNITASNDINEAVLNSLNEQVRGGHEIDSYGIGTHLVTCQAQPALGMVYKLVEIKKQPRIKLSQDASKVTIPGRKEAYRLVGSNGKPLLDLMIGCDETPPAVGKKLLCRNPFDELRRAYVTPSSVIPLHELVWDGENGGIVGKLPTLEERRKHVAEQFELIREDVVRALNPTPYKVSVSSELYDFIHELWMKEFPVQELD